MLSLSLLGPVEICFDDRPLVELTSRKAWALLIYLAVEGRNVHTRDKLMTWFWPDYPRKSAQQNLRQTLYLLRRVLEPADVDTPLILSERFSVSLNPERSIDLDVFQFEALVGRSRVVQGLQKAVELYRGDFLADFYLTDSGPFEEWAAGKRAFYHHRMHHLLQYLTNHYVGIGNLSAAESAVRRHLELDNLHEPAHRQLMEILARDNRRQEALLHYRNLSHRLSDELAITPEPETISLIAAIRAGEFSPQPSSHLHGGPRLPTHNLPQPLTSFIGREKEIEEISDLITQNHLVTVTGTGGIGKTVLCLEVARRSMGAFPDGVWMIELAPITDPALVPGTAANALGLRKSSGPPILELLFDYLKEKRCLLILDNCEHLIEAAAQFSQKVLQACPNAHILASSREVLAVPAEKLFLVPPLSTPDNRQMARLTDWNQYDALNLFVERAKAVLPEFQVTEDNFPSLVRICRQLDGIPLALELAAVRMNALTTAQIAARLDDRFGLLTAGRRTVMPRHQTLRALIDWSWDLLDYDEQRLLSSLAVFFGGTNLEAIEAICAARDLEKAKILDGLGKLVNKSLVIAERSRGPETRYRLLETIRQYAQERLVAAGNEAMFLQRHLDYFRKWGEQAEQALVGPQQDTCMKQLERELDNVRAALAWALEADHESGIILTTALWRFWERGYASECAGWLGRLLENSESVTSPTKAKALWVLARFKYHLAESDHAFMLIDESLALYRNLADRQGIARCLYLKGGFLVPMPLSRNLLIESLTLFREVGDKLGVADTLSSLGHVEERFNYVRAVRYLEESESLYREVGHLAGIAHVLGHFGQVAYWQGDLELARSKLEESLAVEEILGFGGISVSLGLLGLISFELGNQRQADVYLKRGLTLNKQFGMTYLNNWLLVQLGHVCLRTGQVDKAREIFDKCLRGFRDTDVRTGVVYTLEGLAHLEVIQEQFGKAAKLLAWAEVTRQSMPDPRPPIEQKHIDQDIATMRKMMDEKAYAAEFAAGKAMSLDQVIVYALEN